MQTRSVLAGVGALTFGIVTFATFFVANPPGGNFSDSDIADFVTKGHRPAVFLSLYLMLASGIGLLLLLARLREAIQEGMRSRVFWGLGVGAVAAWISGYALVVSVPAALAFGGSSHLQLTHSVIYTFSEAGWAVMYGAGGTLLGCALLTFALGPVAVPAWVRWSTLVAGVAGLAALAWFPFFLVYLWAIVLGGFFLVGRRGPVAVPQAA